MIAVLLVILGGVFAWWTMFGKYYPVTTSEIFWLAVLISLGIFVGSVVGFLSAKKGCSLSAALIGAFLLSVAPSLLAIPWMYYRANLIHKEFSLIKAISETLLYICPGVSLISGMTSLICCGFLYSIFKGCSPSQCKR